MPKPIRNTIKAPPKPIAKKPIQRPTCIACGGSGKNSKGNVCYPCGGIGKKRSKEIG